MKIIKLSFYLFVILIFLTSAKAAYTGFDNYGGADSSFMNYYSGSAGDGLGSMYSTYWPQLGDKESCKSRQDIVLQVAPASCQPAVVRSDLLADQNVPVFCQINAMQLNPLIDVTQINNIRFTGGKYPDGVVGAGFHPAQAALRTREVLMGNPLVNNVGYVVVVLKRNGNESSLPDFINLTLNSQIQYEAGNAFGVGRYEFILDEMSDLEWQNNKNKQSFFRGNFFLRLERAEPEYALISVYSGDKRLYSIRIDKGKASTEVYLPGFYCQVALQFDYVGYEPARERARIEVSDDKGTETFDVFKGSQFLDGRCSVGDIGISSNEENGNVTVRCNYNSQIVLEKKPRTASFKEGDYVSYIADLTKPTVVIKDIKIIRVLTGGEYAISLPTGEINVTQYQLKTQSSSKEKTVNAVDSKYSSEANIAFDEAIAAYEKVADEYSAEVDKQAANETLGELALRKAVDLSKAYGKSETEYRLLNKIIEKYPTSDSYLEYKGELDYLSRVDSSSNAALIYLDGRYRNIRLIDLSLPKKASTASLSVVDNSNSRGLSTNIEFKYGEQNINTFLTDRGFEYMKFNSIDTQRTTFEYKCIKETSTHSVSLAVGNTNTVAIQCTNKNGNKIELGISLRDSDLEKVARIRINPINKNTVSETNLTVGIGIEKRAIQLNPQKTKERISALNASIKSWESISDKLGKAVTGLKSACLATAAVLTAKNFISGASGQAMARQNVMQEIWTKKCQDLVSAHPEKYVSMDDCFRQNANEINKDVAVRTKIIQDQNDKIGSLVKQNENTNSGGLFGSEKVANYDKVGLGFMSTFKQDMSNTDYAAFANGLDSTDYGNGTISYDQMKQMDAYALVIKNPDSSQDAKDGAKLKLKKMSEEITKSKNERLQFAETEKSISGVPGFTNILADKNSKQGIWTSVTVGQLSDSLVKSNLKTSGLTDSSKIAKVSDATNNVAYIVELDEKKVQPDGCIVAGRVYDRLGNEVSDDLAKKVRGGFSCFKKFDQAAYMNKYLNPEVRYYETEPYKGVPEVVPIDTGDGWYAGVKKDYGLLGSKKSVDTSGAVASFWLCNVGANHKEEFREDGFGDDICKRFDFYTGQVLDDFPGITDKSKVKALVTKSVSVLKDAQSKYSSGIKSVDLYGVGKVNVGNPAIAISGSNCQDFMSPGDCQIMFNVCDPVICPNSRCNLGGKFYVQDVIQSGIIGGVLLCLPNIREGIYIPVCLSGIKAGIDGYLSVLKAHRDCLQENVNTGKMIGICDQIYSIYMCDFFWRQIAPAVNVLIPKIIESAVYGRGQSERGGGEYMTVMFAWENAQKSVNYFTQSYAVNSFKAFNLRSTDEVGGQFCKSFISAKGPNTVKSLVAPDSPYQFYASYDSNTYTTATVPATAQYKVFYHIFAGNDAGVYFNVYLKDPPETAYYSASPTLQVGSGFVAKGGTADETKDFTGPEGYKQLCVRINDEEKCGFKQVTTSFAANYLTDQVVKSEITSSNIKTEEGCISGAGLANGDVNTLALINTNLQSGAQEALTGNVYERGIVRVCSTDNPASSTQPSRYVQVGTCSSDGRVKCWLDQKSVNNAITEGDYGTKNATLAELNKINQAYLSKNGLLINSSDFTARFYEIRDKARTLIDTDIDSKKIDDVNIEKVKSLVKEIDDLLINSDYLVLNVDKARLLKIRGEIKDGVARAHLRKIAEQTKNDVKNPTPTTSTTTPAATTTSTSSTVFKKEQSGNLPTVYFTFDNKDQKWKWSFNQVYWQDVTKTDYADSSDEANFGSTPSSDIASILTDLGKPATIGDEQEGNIILLTAKATKVAGTSLQSNIDNSGMRLNSNKYDLQVATKILENGEYFMVYISGTKVKYQNNLLGFDFLTSDTEIGTVNDRTIKLTSSASKLLDSNRFNSINGSRIEDDLLDGKLLKIEKIGIINQNTVHMVGFFYPQGIIDSFSDRFAFKFVNDHVEVKSYIIAGGAGFAIPQGDISGWLITPDGDYNFKNSRGIENYEKTSVNNMMDPTSLDSFAQKIFLNSQDQNNKYNLKIYFPTKDDDSAVKAGYQEYDAGSLSLNQIKAKLGIVDSGDSDIEIPEGRINYGDSITPTVTCIGSLTNDITTTNLDSRISSASTTKKDILKESVSEAELLSGIKQCESDLETNTDAQSKITYLTEMLSLANQYKMVLLSEGKATNEADDLINKYISGIAQYYSDCSTTQTSIVPSSSVLASCADSTNSAITSISSDAQTAANAASTTEVSIYGELLTASKLLKDITELGEDYKTYTDIDAKKAILAKILWKENQVKAIFQKLGDSEGVKKEDLSIQNTLKENDKLNSGCN